MKKRRFLFIFFIFLFIIIIIEITTLITLKSIEKKSTIDSFTYVNQGSSELAFHPDKIEFLKKQINTKAAKTYILFEVNTTVQSIRRNVPSSSGKTYPFVIKYADSPKSWYFDQEIVKKMVIKRSIMGEVKDASPGDIHPGQKVLIREIHDYSVSNKTTQNDFSKELVEYILLIKE